jgi:nitrogen regulatory protein P-II 1
MQEVKAIIQPFRLEEVVHALRQIKNLPAMTISTAHGLSAEHGAFDQVVKTKLEIMVPDELVEPVVEAIAKAAHTGNPGDGRIVVIPILHTVKIRTGEKGTSE